MRVCFAERVGLNEIVCNKEHLASSRHNFLYNVIMHKKRYSSSKPHETANVPLGPMFRRVVRLYIINGVRRCYKLYLDDCENTLSPGMTFLLGP